MVNGMRVERKRREDVGENMVDGGMKGEKNGI